ncbi:GNAT family N-acetyltransferase [Luteipulveratus mongoliensis]|uniref:N-acetyltransferase domain-containing protein n=1 Tax=Luteipulveratus mongoliensis TaxID=571913 RepID=A0A0K1JLR7_9MICO|nr:GNAT family N-acetyltransferase [Luteipulveratus mongoliensis]AKU17656.1 hypothetical protein VV02_20425 [Luteipulveratus mongoliensis]
MNPDPNQPDLTAPLRVGMRIVVRSRLPEGGLTDRLGPLVEADEATLTVRTRAGDVVVRRRDVVAAKEVPPPPARRGRPHLAISMGDLQELMVGGMPGIEQEWLGRWLLRMANGYTGRANSVLPLGDPGAPLDDAMVAVVRWYADRGRPPLVQLFGPVGFDPAADEIGAWAVEHGWRVFQKTLVMTAASADLAAQPAPQTPVEARGTIDDRWFSGTTAREQQHEQTFRDVLDLIPHQRFLTVAPDGPVTAIGRVAFTSGWAGVFGVHVQPAARRQGLARAVMTAAGREAVARGARSTYLQVSADNEAAVALYRSMGFVTHHEYWYARPA